MSNTQKPAFELIKVGEMLGEAFPGIVSRRNVMLARCSNLQAIVKIAEPFHYGFIQPCIKSINKARSLLADSVGFVIISIRSKRIFVEQYNHIQVHSVNILIHHFIAKKRISDKKKRLDK